jgi:hypothetical protein
MGEDACLRLRLPQWRRTGDSAKTGVIDYDAAEKSMARCARGPYTAIAVNRRFSA